MQTKAAPRRAAKELLIAGSVAVGFMILLPLLAAVGLSLQFAFVAGVPLLLVALLLSPSVRRALSKEKPERVRGVSVVWGVSMHPKHSWLRPLRRRVALVGADDFMLRLLGRVERVSLPQPGQQVKQGEVFATLVHQGRDLPVVAPADGVVTRINERLVAEPQLLNDNPYGDGWIAEVRMTSPAEAVAGLLGLTDVVPWIRHEVDRLVALSSGELATGQSLADGGEMADNVGAHLDDAAWQRVRREMFA